MPDAARPSPDEGETRELVVATARALAETGLSAGTSGNVSQRCYRATQNYINLRPDEI